MTKKDIKYVKAVNGLILMHSRRIKKITSKKNLKLTSPITVIKLVFHLSSIEYWCDDLIRGSFGTAEHLTMRNKAREAIDHLYELNGISKE